MSSVTKGVLVEIEFINPQGVQLLEKRFIPMRRIKNENADLFDLLGLHYIEPMTRITISHDTANTREAVDVQEIAENIGQSLTFVDVVQRGYTFYSLDNIIFSAAGHVDADDIHMFEKARKAFEQWCVDNNHKFQYRDGERR